MSLQYRPEIDGFRALAVATVILFHAKVPGFEKGFLGVDIFFVISGFLITSIIYSQNTSGSFSYIDFVQRRVRRILPALLLVMMTCIPFAWFLMLPDPLENFGQSLVATSLISNNILLWLTTGYWDLAVEFKPLLHTWSLGVEEQFYIIYPIALLFALRLPFAKCLLAFVGLATASFAFMLYSQAIDPAQAFYLLHTRAWQLLVGGMAGLLVQNGNITARPLWAGSGLVMILLALSPWPALPILMAITLVTIGSALFFIYAKSEGLESWIFTRRPVIFVGLISYSLYLWHQPALSFLRLSMFEPPRPLDLLFAISAAFVLAVATWHYVEKPFRSKYEPKVAFGSIFGCLIVTVTIGLAFHLSNGFPQRLRGVENADAAGATIAYNERVRRLLPRKLSSGYDVKPGVLVVGNSFGRDFANVLIEAGLKDDLSLLYRDDFPSCAADWGSEERKLIADLDMVIFSSGPSSCLKYTLRYFELRKKYVFFVGPKHFGSNLNPLIRMDSDARANIRLPVPTVVRKNNVKWRSRIGRNYIDIFDIISDDGGITTRVANEFGVLLTTDQIHFSKAGAIFVAQRLPRVFPEIYNLKNAGSNNILSDPKLD